MNGRMSAEELLRYQPKSIPMAILAMCALFLLKSVDFFLHSGVLYTISGILYPLPAALALNTLGNVIMSVIPYFIGKNLGTEVLEHIVERYPRFRKIRRDKAGSTFLFTFLLRCLGLPIPIVGLYMGASRDGFLTYLLGSILGLTPLTIPYTLLGEGTSVRRSWMLCIAVATEVILCALTLLIGHCLRRKDTKKYKHDL